MNKENKYYVYLHRRKDNGLVFYVGKGVGNRCKRKNHRSIKWNNTVEDAGGFSFELFAENLSENEALELEFNLIKTPKDSWRLINKSLNNSTKKIPIEELKKVITYSENSPSGLIWINGNNSFGKAKRESGDFVGYLTSNGYWSFEYEGSAYKAHRVVVMIHGIELPGDKVVNHINHNPSDNRICNLEVISQAENSRRTKVTSEKQLLRLNTTGHCNIVMGSNKNNMRYYRVRYIDEDNNNRTRIFSFNKYGKEKALELAVEFKNQFKKE